MEAVIWIGIAAIIVIAAVIAAIGRPGGGPGRKSRSRNVRSSNSRRRVGSYSGAGGDYSSSAAYGASTWSGDSGSSSCGDSSGGGFSGGGDCGGGGGSF